MKAMDALKLGLSVNGHESIDDLFTDEQIDLQDRRQALTSYLDKRSKSIDVMQLLPSSLAEQLNQRAQSFPVAPVMMVPPLLAICASIFGTRGKVRVKATWREPLIIWVGTVAEPSALKSPVASCMMKPLKAMYTDFLDDYRRRKQQFDSEVADIERMRKQVKDELAGLRKRKHDDSTTARIAELENILTQLEDPQPPLPPRELFVKGVTWARLAEICQNPNTLGIVNYRDELESWFTELDRDPTLRSEWLELWPGESIKLDRKVADSAYAEETAISVFGNTTPDNIRNRIGAEAEDDTQGGDGMWSRMLWCFPPHVVPVWVDEDHDIDKLLGDLYRGIDRLPADDIRINKDARNLLRSISDRYALMATDCDASRAAFIGKLRGYLWRFAGLLNVIDRGMDPSAAAVVTKEQAERAGTLADWFLDQFELLAPLTTKELPSWAGPLLDVAKANGGKAPIREVCRKMRVKADVALARVMTLADEYGLGTVEEYKRGSKAWIAPEHLLNDDADSSQDAV